MCHDSWCLDTCVQLIEYSSSGVCKTEPRKPTWNGQNYLVAKSYESLVEAERQVKR